MKHGRGRLPESWCWAIGLAILAGPILACRLADRPFQIEDFKQLAEARRLLGPAELLGDLDPKEPVFIRFFRPLLHLDFWIEGKLFGLSARAFHLSSIFWHLLAAWLLGRCLRAAGATRPFAAGSSLLFALHPAQFGAGAWIAARGDVLAAVLFLVAVRAFLHRSAAARGLFEGIGLFATAAMLAAKEGAILLPFVLAAGYLAIGSAREDRPRRRIALLLALLGPTAYLLRRQILGSDADTYGGGVRVVTPEILGRMLQDLPRATASLFTGRLRAPRAGLDLVALAALPAFAWSLRQGFRRLHGVTFGRPAWIALAGLAAAMAPVLRILREAEGVLPSRLLYLAGLFTMPLLAAPFARACEPGRARPLALLLAAGVLAAALPATSATRPPVGRISAQVTAAIESAAREFPDARLLVVELPNAVEGEPLFGRFLQRAFRPPFRESPLDVRGFDRADVDRLREAFFNGDKDVLLLAWDAEGRRLERRGAPLPKPRPGPLMGELRPGALEIRFAPPVSVRRAPVFRVRLAEPLRDAGRAQIVFERDSRVVAAEEIEWLPALGTSGEVNARPGLDPSFLFAGYFDCLRIVPIEGASPRLESCEAVAGLDTIGVESPADDALAPASGSEPVFRCRVPAGITFVRLAITRPFRWSKVFATAALPVSGGSVEFRLSTPGIHEGGLDLNWSGLGGGNEGRAIGELGAREFTIEYRIEGFRGERHHPAAESPPRRLRVSR